MQGREIHVPYQWKLVCLYLLNPFHVGRNMYYCYPHSEPSCLMDPEGRNIHSPAYIIIGVCTDTNVIYQSVLEKKTCEHVYRKRHNVVT